MNTKTLILSLIVLITFGCGSTHKQDTPFITIKDGEFQKGNEPYKFIGTNYWYAPVIGCSDKAMGGDRERLIKELDMMKSLGMDNLRIMVGVDGISKHFSHVDFPLQTSPGEYNIEYLEGLDFVLEEMRKREMYAILFLTNNWDWSGGLAQYVCWTTGEEYPYFKSDKYTYTDFKHFVSKFHSNEEAMQLFDNHIKFVLNRKNSISGIDYTEDPAIMAWEVANEPRAFLKENQPKFKMWIDRVCDLIKSIDNNHLVTLGNEGTMGCEKSLDFWREIHEGSSVDYMTIHIWAKNWSWVNSEDLIGTLDAAKEKAKKYISEHSAVAKEMKKPLVLEEFGFPRDHHLFSPNSTTTNRDSYYDFIFDVCVENSKESGVLQGINIWAYGGLGRSPKGQVFWQKGNDLMGDPPQEEQGLNNVFDTDTSTLNLVKRYNTLLRHK
jgi:mannan endo-1,4-beta-mannosidase